MPTVYELDSNSCTMDDVIERALVAFPHVFSDAIAHQLATHRTYLPQASAAAVRGVKASIAACEIAQGALCGDDAPQWREEIREALKLLTFGARVVAFEPLA